MLYLELRLSQKRPQPNSKKKQAVDAKDMKRDEKQFKEWASEYKKCGASIVKHST